MTPPPDSGSGASLRSRASGYRVARIRAAAGAGVATSSTVENSRRTAPRRSSRSSASRSSQEVRVAGAPGAGEAASGKGGVEQSGRGIHRRSDGARARSTASTR